MFKTNIENLYMEIIRYNHAGLYHTYGENLLCTHNLPLNLKRLDISFINEYSDDFCDSVHRVNYLIDNNLPSTLKELKLNNISTEMKNNIKKVPFSCELIYTINDNDDDDNNNIDDDDNVNDDDNDDDDNYDNDDNDDNEDD